MEQRTELPTADEIIAGLDASIEKYVAEERDNEKNPLFGLDPPPRGQNVIGNIMGGVFYKVKIGAMELSDAQRIARAYNEEIAAKDLGPEYKVDVEEFFKQKQTS